MELTSTSSFPPPQRRLRLGFVGGGQGAFIGAVHAIGARLSNRWEIVAGAPTRSVHWLPARNGFWPKSGFIPIMPKWPARRPRALMVLMRW